jgi:hypothetical protein
MTLLVNIAHLQGFLNEVSASGRRPFRLFFKIIRKIIRRCG